MQMTSPDDGVFRVAWVAGTSSGVHKFRYVLSLCVCEKLYRERVALNPRDLKAHIALE